MSFGEYFGDLRKAKGFTQEEIAVAIGKSKMLVSGVETGRNDAFVESDLERITELMNLSDVERRRLYMEASKARSRLPARILEYVSQHDDMYGLLELIVDRNMNSKSLKKVKKYVEEMSNVKNN